MDKGEFVWWSKDRIRKGSISELKGKKYSLTWKEEDRQMSTSILEREVKLLRSRGSFLVGKAEQHPYLKLSPVLNLWLMDREYFESIELRQRDTNARLITDFHQSLVAENYNFLHGIHACELRQHDVEKGCHITWMNVFSGFFFYSAQLRTIVSLKCSINLPHAHKNPFS